MKTLRRPDVGEARVGDGERSDVREAIHQLRAREGWALARCRDLMREVGRLRAGL